MNDLKILLRNRDEGLWKELKHRTQKAKTITEMIALSSLRKRAHSVMPFSADSTLAVRNKIAVVGGSTLYPLSELVEHFIATTVGPVQIMTGEFNNFRSELLEGSEEIDSFDPTIFVVIPDDKSGSYSGPLSDSKADIRNEAEKISAHLLQLCEVAHAKHGAEIILCNYLPSPFNDMANLARKVSPLIGTSNER